MERIIQIIDFAQLKNFVNSWGELVLAVAALMCSIIIASAQNRIALIERRYSVFSEIRRIVSFGGELKALVENGGSTPQKVLYKAMVTMGWGSCIRTVPKLGSVVLEREMNEQRYNTELIVKQADALFTSINNRTVEELLESFEECLKHLYNEYSSEGESHILENANQLEGFWIQCESRSVRKILLRMELNLRYGLPPIRWMILVFKSLMWGICVSLKHLRQKFFVREKAKKEPTTEQEQVTTITADDF